MAIALTEIDERAQATCDLLDTPWPRPVLRVVAGTPAVEGWELDPELDAPARVGDATPVAYRSLPVEAGRTGRRAGPAGTRSGTDVSERRGRGARVRARRRLVAGAVVVGAVVTGLALPLSALGGQPAPVQTAAGSPALAGATVYVVQPGDSLWSIARRMDGGGDPRPLAEAIARETGSATVMPGERIAVP